MSKGCTLDPLKTKTERQATSAMAEFHMHVEVSTDACGSVAYCLRAKITNTITLTTVDYTQRGDIKASGTVLCANAPEEWKQPETLWNEAAKMEKRADQIQARTFEASLPNNEDGGTDEIREELVKEFCQQLANDGMCVSWAIHEPDKENANYHFHAVATVRSVDEDGHFMGKSRKIYEYEKDSKGEFLLDEKGEKIKRLLRDRNGDPKRDKSGRIIYACKKEETNNWNDKEKLIEWRNRWEQIENKGLEKAGSLSRVSCKTNEEQGKITVPQFHLPRKSWERMKAGETDLYVERYKQIEKQNERIREQYPELFNEQGKQIMHIDTAIATLEAQKKEFEKEAALNSSAAMDDKLSDTQPVTREKEETPEKQSATEKTTAQNAHTSAEVEPVGMKVPPETEEKAVDTRQPPSVSPAKPEKQPEQKQKFSVKLQEVAQKIAGTIAGAVNRIKTAYKEVQEERAYAKWYEENKDKTVTGWTVKTIQNDKDKTYTAWIADKKEYKVVEGGLPETVKNDNGHTYYLSSLDKAVKHINHLYERAESEKFKYTVVAPPETVRQWVYPVKLTQRRKITFDTPSFFASEKETPGLTIEEPCFVKQRQTRTEATSLRREKTYYFATPQQRENALATIKKDEKLFDRGFIKTANEIAREEYHETVRTDKNAYRAELPEKWVKDSTGLRIFICKDKSTGELFGSIFKTSNDRYVIDGDLFKQLTAKLAPEYAQEGKHIDLDAICAKNGVLDVDFHVPSCGLQFKREVCAEVTARHMEKRARQEALEQRQNKQKAPKKEKSQDMDFGL